MQAKLQIHFIDPSVMNKPLSLNVEVGNPYQNISEFMVEYFSWDPLDYQVRFYKEKEMINRLQDYQTIDEILNSNNPIVYAQKFKIAEGQNMNDESITIQLEIDGHQIGDMNIETRTSMQEFIIFQRNQLIERLKAETSEAPAYSEKHQLFIESLDRSVRELWPKEQYHYTLQEIGINSNMILNFQSPNKKKYSTQISSKKVSCNSENKNFTPHQTGSIQTGLTQANLMFQGPTQNMKEFRHQNLVIRIMWKEKRVEYIDEYRLIEVVLLQSKALPRKNIVVRKRDVGQAFEHEGIFVGTRADNSGIYVFWNPNQTSQFFSF